MATVQLWCNKHLRQSFEVIKHIVPILMHHKQSRNTLNLFANDRCLYEGPCSLAVAMASKLEECKSGLLLHCWSLFPFESKMATVRSITSWRPYSLYSITQKEVLLWPQPMMSTAKTAKPGNNVALKMWLATCHRTKKSACHTGNCPQMAWTWDRNEHAFFSYSRQELAAPIPVVQQDLRTERSFKETTKTKDVRRS